MGFALRPGSFRPIEREYGSATSSASETPPAHGLFGTKENGRESRRASPRVAEADEGEIQETGAGRRRELAPGSASPGDSGARCEVRAEYLIVDGHSVIFAWPELRKLHSRRTSLARDELTKKLRDYQDWTGTRVAVVFDGKGSSVSVSSDPGEIQIF